ncbi:rpsR, partial [Symbiodinium sp. KB8]
MRGALGRASASAASASTRRARPVASLERLSAASRSPTSQQAPAPAVARAAADSRAVCTTAAVRASASDDSGPGAAASATGASNARQAGAGTAADAAAQPASATAQDSASGQGITTVECDDLPAGRPVGLLGLHSLGKSSFPGSSVPFEPLSVFPGHAQEVWAGLGMGSKKGDLPPEELIATPFDHPAQSVASNTKEMFHRYPQFTQADVDAAKLKNLRRIHDLGRWMRFHEDGTTFNDHLAEDEAAVRAHGLRRTPEERLLELAKRQAAPRMKQWGAWAIAFADAPGFDELVEEAASEPGEFAQIKQDIVTAGTYFQQERSDVSEEQMATAEECRLRVDAFMERLVDLGIVARYEPAVGPNVAAMEKRAAKASPIPPTPLKQFVEEDAELREQLRQAVKDGDDVKAKQIAAKMLPLGRRMTQEQTAQALVDEGKGMVTYQRRLARFVDAVYGAETGVSALPQDIVSTLAKPAAATRCPVRRDAAAMSADKFWNPHHPRDEHGMPLDDEEELYSLENILGESDPLRKRFLDREATGGLSHRDVRRGGLHLGYCIFCSHGDGHGAPQGLPLLREDNTLLLSKLVAPDGRILPRRFTGVCAKHQRSVSRTIKRSRAMGFMPFQKKLPPQLRFTSMNPDPVSTALRERVWERQVRCRH